MIRLHVDPEQTSSLNPIWLFGANTCHAPLWLRDDLLHQLKRAHDELGFQHIRAHGTLGDPMGTVADDGSFDFSRLITGFERLLSVGYKPFVELSHMPSALASNDESVTHYIFRSGPPKDWSRWSAMIDALMQALVDRFGLDELRQWYFEVWNEPDIAFWTGSQAQYFKLYDLTAASIKQVDPALRVGGPATARTAWIDEFLEHITTPSDDYPLDTPRCDFVSTHAYPSDLVFLDADQGDVQLQEAGVMRELFTAVRRKVDAVLGEDFPVYCGEWNSSAGPLVENHDNCNNAAYIVKTLVELCDVCQGSLIWNLSDIYEECQFHYEPFHGGYGQMTVNDVPKAGWHAFALLAEHHGERLAVDTSADGVSLTALASRHGDSIRVLLAHYIEPDTTPGDLTVSLDGLPAGSGTITRLLPGAGSAFERWVELGRPPYLNRERLDDLLAASAPQVQDFDRMPQQIDMPAGTIAQIHLRVK